MKSFLLDLAKRVTIAVASAMAAGFVYEQARKAGQKSEALVKKIEEWDRRTHG